MDFLSGKPMIFAPVETIPEILGKAHAALHRIEPESLIESLNEQGIDENQCRLDNRFNILQNIADELPWIYNGVDWLMENRPSESGRLAICHGDFHPLNILIQDDRVTGVLDWPGFLMGGYVFPPRVGFPQWIREMDWNVQVDVESAHLVLQQSTPTLVPLSVTVETALRRVHLTRLRQSGALAQPIARQAEAFAKDEKMEAHLVSSGSIQFCAPSAVPADALREA